MKYYTPQENSHKNNKNSLILIKHKSNHERKFLCTKRFIYSVPRFRPLSKIFMRFIWKVRKHLKLSKSFLRTSSPKLITCAMLPKHWCFLIVNVVKHKMLLKWSNFTIRRYCRGDPQSAQLSGRKSAYLHTTDFDGVGFLRPASRIHGIFTLLGQ